ncbi:MAG TPA: DUF4349 domain-containing protein, partial [Gaiellaceae bacterium]|nr:DUF4349 domain-containing protein [Gaiellaceae bacterium]
ANPPIAPDTLRRQVLAGEPRRRRLPSRRLVLVVVPVAVALAVGAALVHGFVSSGSHSVAMEPSLKGAERYAGPAKREVTHGGTATSSLQNLRSAPQPAAPNAWDSATRTMTTASGSTLQNQNYSFQQGLATVTIPKNRLVHADATLQVRVPSHSALTKATNEATQIVGSLGGYAQSVQYQSSRNGTGNAFLELRVPVGKAETALAKLASLGTLVSQQVSTQDLQQQYTQQTNSIGTLRREIAVYVQALQSTTLSATERVALQIKLENARHSLKLLKKARTATVAAGATANISLTLTTNKDAGIVPAHHTTGRFDRLLGSAARFLALEGTIVLYALVVLSPFLILGGLTWWILRERRRREESRLLASA